MWNIFSYDPNLALSRSDTHTHTHTHTQHTQDNKQDVQQAGQCHPTLNEMIVMIKSTGTAEERHAGPRASVEQSRWAYAWQRRWRSANPQQDRGFFF